MFDLKLSNVQNGTNYYQALGRLTHSTIEAHDSIDDILSDDVFNQNVVVDLEGLDMVDSSGIGWLLVKNRQFKAQGGKLVLHSLQPNVKNVFGLMKLGAVFTLAESQEEANGEIGNTGVEQ